ncbi:MAG: hypothetical protein IMZ61_10775 [Planctomycetes bacterium]|nr:hypothetical protein [Planctomycetota bacterium]
MTPDKKTNRTIEEYESDIKEFLWIIDYYKALITAAKMAIKLRKQMDRKAVKHV